MLIASASIGYTTGVVAGNFSWYAFPFIFLLAFVFAPKYLSANVQTLPEFMGERFGQSTRSILAWYTVATILILWLSLTLYAGGILVNQILGFPLWLSVLILVLIASFFTISGGLEAIAYTNVFQMVLLILVSLMLTIAGIIKAGGLTAIVESTPANYWNLFQPSDDPNYPWIAILLGYPVMGVWFWCTDQSMVQSVLGAKNLRQGQVGANFTGWLKILDVFLFILPGIICYIIFPEVSDPDEAYMTMVTQLLPAGMKGLVMAVLIAALISTIDSALNSLSTVFTMDIYVKRFKTSGSQREIVKIGRIVTVAGSLVAIGLTLAINTIKGMNLFDVFQSVLGFLAPPMSVVFLLGVLWKRMTTRAANLILSLGTVISIGVGVVNLVFTLSGMYLIDRSGRKQLMYIGSFGYILSLFMVAYGFYTDASAIFKLVFILVFIASHAIGQGAVIWVFISEIFPNDIRKQNGAIGIILQSINQLPQNSTSASILENTQVIYSLRNEKGYDELQKRLNLSSHDLNQLRSIRNNLTGDRKYTEMFIKIGKESNIFRLEVPPEVFAAYLTDGSENEAIMTFYEKTNDMEKAINEFINSEN